MLKKIFIIVFCLGNLLPLKAGLGESEEAVRILTIGNSFSNNACQYLEQIAQSVSGCEIKITKANIGGCSLQKHASLIDACERDANLKPYGDLYSLKELLLQHTYDYITIQQVSSESFKAASFEPHAEVLVAFIREHAPEAEIVVHQTWAYSPDADRLKDWNLARQTMHDSLVKNYQALAERYNLGTLLSGSAFYLATLNEPNLQLWADDGYHANKKGCYLAGCVWFGSLFQISPKRINFEPPEIAQDQAKYLRKMAARTLKKASKK